MGDYETSAAGSHCVKRDVFGHCIYSHNTFAKGNSRLGGMPDNAMARGPISPDPALGPIVPEDERDEFSYEGQVREVVSKTLTPDEQDSLHMSAAAGMHQSLLERDNTSASKARAHKVIQEYLDRNLNKPHVFDDRSNANNALFREDLTRITHKNRRGNARPTDPIIPTGTRSRAPSEHSTYSTASEYSAGARSRTSSEYSAGARSRASSGATETKANDVAAPDRAQGAPTTLKQNARNIKARQAARRDNAYEVGRAKSRVELAEASVRDLQDVYDTHMLKKPVAGKRTRGAIRSGVLPDSQSTPANELYFHSLEADRLQRFLNTRAVELQDARDAHGIAIAKAQSAETPKGAPKGAPSVPDRGSPYRRRLSRLASTGPSDSDGPARPRSSALTSDDPRALDIGRPRSKYKIFGPGSRTDARSNLSGFFKDWGGNFSLMAGDALKHFVGQDNPVAKALLNFGQTANKERVKSHVDFVNDITNVETHGDRALRPEDITQVGGNSRAGPMIARAFNELGPEYASTETLSINSPYMGQDEIDAARGSKHTNLRAITDPASSGRLLNVTAIPGLGPLRGPNTSTFRGNEGGMRIAHSATGTANTWDIYGTAVKAANALILNGAQLRQMNDVHKKLEAVDNSLTPDEAVENTNTNLLDEDQIRAMRGDRDGRTKAIADATAVYTASNAAHDKSFQRIKAYQSGENLGVKDTLGKFWNKQNVNTVASAAGIGAGFLGGLGLDWAEDKLHIGLHSQYIKPGANAFAVNAVLEGAGAKFSSSSRSFLSGLTLEGGAGAIGGALLGNAVTQAMMPKDGWHSEGQAAVGDITGGAAGGLVGEPIGWAARGAFNGLKAIKNYVSKHPAVDGLGDTAADVAGDAADGVGDAADGVGDAADATAGTAETTTGTAEEIAAIAADGAADGVEGADVMAWAGPLGIAGGLAFGALLGAGFGAIGYAMDHSDIKKHIKERADHIAAEHLQDIKNDAINNYWKNFKPKVDFGNLSQMAINTISGGTADTASFLG